MSDDLNDLGRTLDRFATGKQNTSRSQHRTTELEPTAENLKRAEAQLEKASLDEKKELLKFINNTRRTLGMKDYENEIPRIPIPIKASDIDYGLAERAYTGTSFSPEERAVQEQQGYLKHIESLYNELLPYAETDAQKKFLELELTKYASKYAKYRNEILSSRSRIISPMIAGPSKFPTERMRKLNEALDKKEQKLMEWGKRSIRNIKRDLKQVFIEEKGGEVAVLEEELRKLEDGFWRMKEINKIVRKKGLTDEQKLDLLRKAGINEKVAREALSPEFVGVPDYTLTSIRNKIKTRKERIEALKAKEAKKGYEEAKEFIGGKTIKNYDIDRLQIFFDEIPLTEVRTELKSHGWHWSPSNEAWQRKITPDAEYSANEIIERFYKSEEKAPEEEPKDPWQMTREEWLRKHIKNVDTLDKWVKQAELGETVEVSTTEIDGIFPMGNVFIYGNIVSRTPSMFDGTRKVIYINIDKPSDFIAEVLNIKDKTIQVYYALLHEAAHLKWSLEGKPLNPYSPETQYEKYYSHPSEVAAREASDEFFRSLLDAHRKAIHEALKEGKPVPAEVLAEYPEDGEKKEPWQMTRDEFNYSKNEPRVAAIKKAIEQGRAITLATQYKSTQITSPDHIKIDNNGDVRIPEGKKWVALTDDAITKLAEQAGMKPTPLAEKTYHHAEVEKAIAQGKPVPEEVLAEYPELLKEEEVPETPQETIARVMKFKSYIGSRPDWQFLLQKAVNDIDMLKADRYDLMRATGKLLGYNLTPEPSNVGLDRWLAQQLANETGQSVLIIGGAATVEPEKPRIPPIRKPSLEYVVELINDKVIKCPRKGFEFKVKTDYEVFRNLGELSPLTEYDEKRNCLIQEAISGRFATEEELEKVGVLIRERGYIPRGLLTHDVIVTPIGQFKVVDVGHFERIKEKKNPWQMTWKEYQEHYIQELTKKLKRARNEYIKESYREAIEAAKKEDTIKLAHFAEVNNALERGKPVPEEVLRDYPELQKKKEAKERLFYKYVKKELDEGAVVYTSYPTPVSEILIAQLPDGRWNVDPNPPIFPMESFKTRTEALEYAETNMKTIIAEEKKEEAMEEKEPWMMTKEEFWEAADKEWYKGKKWINKEEQLTNIRKEVVRDAVEEGKPVPASVLADYPELVEKEEKVPIEEHARFIGRLKSVGVEIDKVPAFVEVGDTLTVVGKYGTYRLNFALGEISREDMPKFITLTLKGKVMQVKKSPEAELLKKKLREEEKRVKQLKLREERRLEFFEENEQNKINKIPEEELSLYDRLQLKFLEESESI